MSNISSKTVSNTKAQPSTEVSVEIIGGKPTTTSLDWRHRVGRITACGYPPPGFGVSADNAGGVIRPTPGVGPFFAGSTLQPGGWASGCGRKCCARTRPRNTCCKTSTAIAPGGLVERIAHVLGEHRAVRGGAGPGRRQNRLADSEGEMRCPGVGNGELPLAVAGKEWIL